MCRLEVAEIGLQVGYLVSVRISIRTPVPRVWPDCSESPRRRQNIGTLRGWLFQTNGHSSSLIGALRCTSPGKPSCHWAPCRFSDMKICIRLTLLFSCCLLIPVCGAASDPCPGNSSVSSQLPVQYRRDLDLETHTLSKNHSFILLYNRESAGWSHLSNFYCNQHFILLFSTLLDLFTHWIWWANKIPAMIDWLIWPLIYYSTPMSREVNEILMGVSVYFTPMLRSPYQDWLFMQRSKLHVKTLSLIKIQYLDRTPCFYYLIA